MVSDPFDEFFLDESSLSLVHLPDDWAYKVPLRGYGNVADAISRGLCPTFLEPFLDQVGLRIRLLL